MSEKVSAKTATFVPPKPVVMPDWYHNEFHEFMEGVQVAAHLEGDYAGPDDDDEGEDRARRAIRRIRRQDRFDPKKFGQEEALKNTKRYLEYLEKSDFHFRDTRRGMEYFLNNPFPCGIRPRELIKRLRIYVRCEDFLEWAGWELNPEGEDYGDGGAEEADEDFEWQAAEPCL
jgi:hypothetical protein